MNKSLFYYNCDLIKVIDADTIYVLVDLGFKTYAKKVLRLARINSSELTTSDGKAAKQYLLNILSKPGIFISFTSTKLDMYGRSIAEVYISSNLKNPELDLICLNDSLVSNNHAIYKEYK